MHHLFILILVINSGYALFDYCYNQERSIQTKHQILVLLDTNLITHNGSNNMIQISFSKYFEENMLNSFLNTSTKIFYKTTQIFGKKLDGTLNHLIRLRNEINSNENLKLVVVVSNSLTLNYFQLKIIKKPLLTICTNKFNTFQSKELNNITPSLHALIKVVLKFKKINKLDNLFVFTSDNYTKYEFNYFKQIYPKIKLVETIKSFDAIQTEMAYSLILLKSNVRDLINIRTIILNPMQIIVWLPEDSMSDIKNPAEFNGYKFFRLNWNLNLDYTLGQIVDQLLDKEINLQVFQEEYLNHKKKSIENLTPNDLNYNAFAEMFTIGKFVIERISSPINEKYTFEIKNNKISILDGTKSSEIKNDNKATKFKIVSNQIEPFLMSINSYDSKCIDGKQCLDLEALSQTILQNLTFSDKFSKNLKLENSENNLIKCCKGYITDLLDRLSIDLNFEYELMISNEKKYSENRNGAINEVLKDIAHIAAGPFRINENQSHLVDFSVPFLYSGYGILMKQKNDQNNDLFMFLKPFTYLHWIIIWLVAFASAVALSLLEFISPFGLNPNGRARNRNYTLGSGITMVMSLMFMHTMPAKSPKSWAGKWTQNFIAAYSIIFISTYTAQMAFILSNEQKNINPVLINHQEFLSQHETNLKLGSLECNENIYRNFNCNNLIKIKNDIEGVQSINERNGSLDAYISDYLLLKYLKFKQIDCSLQIISDEFLINGYGLVFSKGMNQQDKNDINMKIFDYQENGFLDELYSKYFQKRLKCNEIPNNEKISLNLPRYKGVYAYLGIGIITAVLVLFLEQALYKYTIPFLRSKDPKSQWRSLKLMYLSQRFYRIVDSIEMYDASHSAKKLFDLFKRGDFEAIFQKSFRKKQMEIFNTSKLRKRPKFWALIEATTEDHLTTNIITDTSKTNLDKVNLESTLKTDNTDGELAYLENQRKLNSRNFNLDDNEDFMIDMIDTPRLGEVEAFNMSDYSLSSKEYSQKSLPKA